MNWFTKIFSSGVKDVIGEVHGIVDTLHTSTEEKLEAQQKITSIMNAFKLTQEENANNFESEVTQRHANDMKSDSWLSKNIRPMVLLITMITIYLLVYATVFAALKDSQIEVLKAWVPMLSGLFGTMVVFYFGSRGLEKIQTIRKEKNNG